MWVCRWTKLSREEPLLLLGLAIGVVSSLLSRPVGSARPAEGSD